MRYPCSKVSGNSGTFPVKLEQFKNIEDIDAYLKEIDNVIAQENAKFEASKKALEKKANLKNKK